MELSEQEQVRREKLEKIKSLGINPYPAELYPVSDYSIDIKNNFKENSKVVLAGRLMSRRIQGNASFAELQDSKGRIQLYFNRDEICSGEDKHPIMSFTKNFWTLEILLELKVNYSKLKWVKKLFWLKILNYFLNLLDLYHFQKKTVTGTFMMNLTILN